MDNITPPAAPPQPTMLAQMIELCTRALADDAAAAASNATTVTNDQKDEDTK